MTKTTAAASAPFLSMGFRPFFTGAILFALLSMGAWLAIYSLNLDIGLQQLSSIPWHAHEMIYGYGMAVIAGFLLTAVSNWTGLQTTNGLPLLAMFACWIMARWLPFIPIDNVLWLMFAFDSLFMLGLLIAISLPVIRVRQWRQAGILAKIALLLAANCVFYLGATGHLHMGILWGNNAGLYLVLALILMMARRVIPFFIEKGCGLQTPLRNWRRLDISSMILFLCFMIGDIRWPDNVAVMIMAAILAILHSLRLYLWHVAGIWSRALLWVLFAAYLFIIAGFVLKALAYFAVTSPLLAVHAFAAGGIGIMTMGMMARVSLAHTGRRVDSPPRKLGVVFALLISAALVRVALPVFAGQHYTLWITISQALWLLAFAAFAVYYLPVLLSRDVTET